MADVFTYRPPSGGSGNLLTPLRPARDALQIDVVFVERPLGDPLLGKTLWNDVDQVAGFDSTELDGLKQLGILIGNSGQNPCPALERMLRETADPLEAEAARNCMPLKKQTFCLRNAETCSIETNALAKCTVELPLYTGAKEKTYENFKSILRLTAFRVQDGWARLEFAPEIHHGVDRLRPDGCQRRMAVAGGSGNGCPAPAVFAQAACGRNCRHDDGAGKAPFIRS